MKFKKKPIVIDAVKYTGDNAIDIMTWDEEVHTGVGRVGMHGDDLVIQTLDGFMTASQGDWIIRGVKNEIYPCKADIFEMTYEPA